MQTFNSDGVEIAYLDEGSRRCGAAHPRLCLQREHQLGRHRLGEDADQAGYRVVAYDNRGHGRSEKLYDLEDYGAPIMAEDARRLLDHLGIERAHVIGLLDGRAHRGFPRHRPSGPRSQPRLRRARPQHGARRCRHGADRARARGGEHRRGDQRTARTFRAFAEQTKSDLKALAACIRSARAPITPEALGALRCPVLVVVGEKDVIGGSASRAGRADPRRARRGAAGRDHMKAVGDKGFKEAVLGFFAAQQ